MSKNQYSKLKYTIFLLWIYSNLFAQIQVGEISPNFSAPICANSDETTFNLYDYANGNVNGGEYKVVWLNLFTSW